MAEFKIPSLPEEDAIEQIVETVRQAETGTAPFALVLGAGFSHGLVPTARELVEVGLPLWVESIKNNQEFEQLRMGSADQHSRIARAFWQQFVEQNARRGLDLGLNSLTGLPEDYAEAYKAAFDPNYFRAVGEPAQARRFQRALMRLDQTRLNAAHFLLASLLGVQPGKSRRNELFKARAAFCRLILTTNFDPFLQTALQAVNRLYFMSDTPEVGVSDEILDDQTDAIHLVYLHGSIHRRSQAATDDDIKVLKEKNARTLAPVLKRHGVIVLGYSGWDDAIVEALAACDRFDYRLYWCGRESDPLVKGAFGPRVTDILRKPTAYYLKISSAGEFMAQLCARLVEGLPRLLVNPIGQLREMLDTIDMKELELIAAPVSAGSNSPQISDGRFNPDAFVKAQRDTIERLIQAEQAFFSGGRMAEAPQQDRPGQVKTEAQLADSRSQARRLLSSARVADALGNYEESLKLCTEGLSLDDLKAAEQAELLIIRALAFYFRGRTDEAVADWTKVIELPDAPIEQVAQALVNRGITWGQKGDTAKALADYTRVIEQLPDAPVEQVATAFVNRGITWGQKGDTAKELADYTRVIEQLPDAPVEQVATAFVNRGITWGQKGDTAKALADYTRVIEQLPDAPVEQVAKALVNRGITWGQKGDTAKALADYTRVIEQLPDAPVEQVATALVYRGITWGQKGDTAKELADYTRVIEQLPDAPVEQVATALVNRGITWGQKGDTAKALADYTRVIEQLPDAPVEQVAKALVNRGITWGQKGDTAKALADYTRVIEQLPDAPVEQVAQALVNRGITWGQKGDTAKELADYTRVIEQLPDAPVEQVAQALVYRGITWGQKGDTAKELADYTRVIEQLPDAPVEQVATALVYRGITWGQKGDTAKELADYTRVIEQLPDAPVEQVATALANRGWINYKRDAYPAFLADTAAALNKHPELFTVAFNLGLALLALGRDAEALVAYRVAAERFPNQIDTEGLSDLAEAQKSWLTEDRAEPVIQLLRSLKP